MSHIYHERQLGGLCGVHCLNNLLQGPRFGPGDLAEIGVQLDRDEKLLLGSDASEPYNVDPSADGGNFSIQVLTVALERYQLELLPAKHPKAKDPMKDPAKAAQAYLCQYHDHWFAIRSVADCWWNLNSTKARPTLISPFYLAAWMTQLTTEGYSIFLIVGDLPEPAVPGSSEPEENFHDIFSLLEKGSDQQEDVVIPPEPEDPPAPSMNPPLGGPPVLARAVPVQGNPRVGHVNNYIAAQAAALDAISMNKHVQTGSGPFFDHGALRAADRMSRPACAFCGGRLAGDALQCQFCNNLCDLPRMPTAGRSTGMDVSELIGHTQPAGSGTTNLRAMGFREAQILAAETLASDMRASACDLLLAMKPVTAGDAASLARAIQTAVTNLDKVCLPADSVLQLITLLTWGDAALEEAAVYFEPAVLTERLLTLIGKHQDRWPNNVTKSLSIAVELMSVVPSNHRTFVL